MLCKQLTSGIKRTVSIVALMCVIAVSVSAYTVVMRNGRRVEIGSRFVVTQSTLTYEVSPGFQVTLQMQAIDIGATERANHEQPGALLRRAVPSSSITAPDIPTGVPGAVRTITNRDLEATAERRRHSEVAYNKRLQQLGLPSLEESRYLAAIESEAIREELKEMKGAEKQSENYWRSRASALRTEMAVLDAEIQFVGARIDEYAPENLGASFNSVTTVSPFLTFGNDRRYFPRRNRGVFGDTYNNGRSVASARPSDSQRTGRRYGRGRGRYDRNPYGRYGNGQIVIGTGIDVFPNIGTVSSIPSYDYSYERSLLITRFNELSAERAGFSARWRQLEEEARRAGVPPGWLRE
jgi:hypothetical protein